MEGVKILDQINSLLSSGISLAGFDPQWAVFVSALLGVLAHVMALLPQPSDEGSWWMKIHSFLNKLAGNYRNATNAASVEDPEK